jgi:hypothetical protein
MIHRQGVQSPQENRNGKGNINGLNAIHGEEVIMPIKSLKIILLIIPLLSLVGACGREASAPTQVIIITSPPIIITATEPPMTPTSTPLPTSTPPPSAENLDRYPQDWKIFTEGSPIAEVKGATNPSLDGEALQCSLKGGEPYSNAHCYLNLPAEPDISLFTLSMSFLFTSATSCNNQYGTASTVQALEFSMSNWTSGRRFEFALQWQNVGDGAPQWRYWDPHQAEDRRWKPIDAKITQCLEGDKWHTLQLEGSTNSIEVHYNRFTINNQTYELNFSTARVNTPGEADRLAVAIQLDGNAHQAPYDVFIDKVNFTRQGTTSSAPMSTDCSLAKIDELPTTNSYVDKNIAITWTPSTCLMNVQLYQNGNLLRENRAGDASGTVNMSGIPLGTVEIKIWLPGAGNPSDSKILRIR